MVPFLGSVLSRLRLIRRFSHLFDDCVSVPSRFLRGESGAEAGRKRDESGTKAGRNWDESRAKVGGLSGALTGLVSIRLSPALLCPGQAHDEGNIKRREDEGQKRKIRENKNSVTRHPPIRPTLAGLQQLDYSVRHSSIAFSQGV